MTQSPEAFKFGKLTKFFDPTNGQTQELAWHLPKETKKYLNFNFKNNLKLTYNFELEYASYLIKYLKENSRTKFTNINSKDFFITNGIKNFMLRIYPKETKLWLNNIYSFYKEIENQYGNINNITLSQTSRFGLVMFLELDNKNEVIIKLIPKFLERYQTEKNAYLKLSNKYMCKLISFDDENNALFMPKLYPIQGSIFNNNKILTNFFERVFENSTVYTKELENNSFKNFYENLKSLDLETKYSKNKNTILKNIRNSINLYQKYFSESVLYLIHGDLRKENILRKDNTLYAIDPIGYVAPIVFETSRFIIDDICSNKDIFEEENRLAILIEYFSKWFDKKELIIATYIFLSVITYNSVWENEEETETEYYLELLEKIYKNIK